MIPEGATCPAPWANLGLGFAACILKTASQAKAPRQTIAFTVGSSSSSRMAYGRQESRSSGVGLFCGGAQRTAAEIQSPRRRKPSLACLEIGLLEKPVRYSAPKRKFPERSPVK